jgi:multidrug efflux system outer membrane protein
MADRVTKAALVAAALALGACSFAPKYERPAAELPQVWPLEGASATHAPADRWWSVYQEPALDALVEEALANNRDIAIAVARVDEARALLQIERSNQFPAAGANFEANRTKASERTALAFPPFYRSNVRATVDLSFELDLWGRLRNATDAARAELLATEAARDTVRIALVSDVAQGYFNLRALDEQVAATERALALRSQALDLERQRAASGLISDLDVRQLEAEVEAARSQLPALRRDQSLQEAALAVLAGRSPRAIVEESIARSQGADMQRQAVVVPAGLPSDLLLRRPDLFEAEQRLVAANYRIGVARANFFPRISLTGFLGSEARSLSDLFTGGSGIGSLVGGVTQPLFQGGRLLADKDAAEARQRQAIAQYEKTIQVAFREVRDAINVQTRAREIYEAESARVTALSEALRLARARYIAGLASLLTAIDAERNLLQAELNRIDAVRQQRAAVADLMRALGGGWTAPEDPALAHSGAEAVRQ